MEASLSVLVVDDNPLNRCVAVELVRLLGHEAHEAVDGLDALAKSKELSPLLILMDLNMPNLNGLLATSRIREMEASEQRSRSLIYMWTASGHITEADRRRIGADGSLTKPLLIDELKQALSSASTLSPGGGK